MLHLISPLKRTLSGYTHAHSFEEKYANEIRRRNIMAVNAKKETNYKRINQQCTNATRARFFLSSCFPQICVSQIKRFLSAAECNHIPLRKCPNWNWTKFGVLRTELAVLSVTWMRRFISFHLLRRTLLHLPSTIFVERFNELWIVLYSRISLRISLRISWCSFSFRQQFEFLCQHQSFRKTSFFFAYNLKYLSSKC